MNFSILKHGFIEYLKEIGEIQDNENFSDIDSSVSIFMHSDKFEDYISDELNLDSSGLAMDFSDLMEFDFENGEMKLKEENENYLLNDTPEENTNSETDGSELIVNMFNELLKTNEFKNAIDKNNDGISSDELNNFFTTIKSIDSDEWNISLSDLITSSEQIKKGEFTTEQPKEITNLPEEVEINTDEAETTLSTQSGNSNFGSTSDNGYSYTGSPSSPTINNTTKEKDISNMSKEELNKELDSLKSTLGRNKNTLSSILNGTEDGLVKLKEMEENEFKNYEEELKTLDEEKAKQLNEKETSINEKEKEIDKKTQEISDQETTVSDAENTYNNAVSSRESLETTLTLLESTDTSKMEYAQQAEISNKISSLKVEIEEAKKSETKAKETWDEAQKKLDSLKEEKTKLDEELAKLNEDLTAFEQQILGEYPQIAESQQAYNDTKKEREEYKTSASEATQKQIQEVQKKINEINTALTNIDNKEKSKEYKVNTFGDDVIDYAKQFIGANEADGSANKFVASAHRTAASTPWCAAFVQYVMENSDSAENVPDWYKNIGNKWWCPNVANAAKEADAYINGDEAKPGDIVLFDYERDGRMNHIGIVVSNENGKLITIEGNTSNQVAEREYDTNDPRLKYCKMTA